jgi:hypothetical protein
MNELAAPMSRDARRWVRVEQIRQLVHQRALLDLQLRQQLTVLHTEDTDPGWRRYVADELALALSESPRTCARWVDEALMFSDYPAVMALVADGTFSVRHADAVLHELVGARLGHDAQQQVLDLVLAAVDNDHVRTPLELRKATRAAVLLHDLDAAERKQQTIEERRTVGFYDDSDGSVSAIMTGTKTKLATLQAALEAAVGIPLPGDTRSFGQRKFDYLLDLVCGRVDATAPWQALIVVSLDTLTASSDTPAEIPGLGLVTAEEARDVLGHAELRRVVVDTDGMMVSVDPTTHTPDLTPTPQPTAATVHTDATEPAPADDDLDLTPDDQHSRPTLLDRYCDSHRPLLLGDLIDEVMDEVMDELMGEISDELSPPTGAGESQPEHPPPSADDREWREAWESIDRTQDILDADTHAQHEQVSPGSVLHQTRPPHLAPSLRTQQRREQRLSHRAELARWTVTGLHQAVHALLTSPVAPKPDASQGYPFRGRLAHWLKTRDITCTFPGCPHLAQRCQSDHVVEFPAGPTHVDNGATECTHHHQAKHASIPASRHPDGTMRWQPPSSPAVDRPPRPLLRGW